MDFIDAQKEVLGESILTDRQLIIDYDRRRNGNREALRALKNATDNQRLVQEVEEIRERILHNTQKLEESEGSQAQQHKEGTFLKSFDLKPIAAAELYNIDPSRD
ncbi:hypothetical protein IWQ61_001763 [Dispira simplex]|nr:hypothetical protein IWQ61_001763 [Dispira simplex]